MVDRPAMGIAEFAAAFGEPDRLAEILDDLPQPLYLVDRERTIRFWNRACERVSGFRAEDVVGRSCFDEILRHIDERGRSLCSELCPLAATMHDGRSRCGRVWLHHRDGHRVPISVVTQPVRDATGTVVGGIESFTDESSLTQVRERLHEMEHLAMVDSLTDVPNRRFLEVVLSSRLAEMRRFGSALSVAIVDVDDFKLVNDRFGHQTGDAALRMVATVMAANQRTEDVVARLAGDEFVLLLSNAGLQAAVEVCERLRMLIASSDLQRGDVNVAMTASFGVTAATEHDTVESVLQRADQLLYRAKLERDRVVAG